MTSDARDTRHSLDLSTQAGAGPPVHWPSLTDLELECECADLWSWVRQMRVRFPHALRFPDCWWLHNDLIELLLALRDYERYAFSGVAGAAGAVAWHGALRDVEARLESWTRRLRCALPGRGHGSGHVDGDSPGSSSGGSDGIVSASGVHPIGGHPATAAHLLAAERERRGLTTPTSLS